MGSCSISTHALREEGDPTAGLSGWSSTNFYPRPPRGGRPLGLALSTAQSSISTHALREEGDANALHYHMGVNQFLPTPSARRATRQAGRGSRPACHFYPRPPRGGRRDPLTTPEQRRRISTHALREEGDARLHCSPVGRIMNFYPRPPRGGRPFCKVSKCSCHS